MAAVLLLGVAPGVAAQEPSDGGAAPVFHNIGTVTEPAIAAITAGVTATNPTGKFASFDISWVDRERDLYYLADRSNDAIDVVDATDGSFVKFLGQGKFAGVVAALNGANRNGPDGVVTDSDSNVWVGDGVAGLGGGTTSSLKEFDPDSGNLLATVDTGGTGRSDELAFGPVGGGRILIANPNEATSPTQLPAFVSLVNTRTRTIIGKVVYDEGPHSGLPAAGHGFNTFFAGAQHGLEQSTFLNGHFYLNVPATIQNPGGEIDVFDANMARITAVLPLVTCGGTGLDSGPRSDLLVECGDSARIIDINGNEEARFTELGGADEIWFNKGDGNAYFPLPASTALGRPASGLGVLDAVHNHSLGVTVVAGAQGLHSIAADSNNNRIFLPISDNPDNGAGGIAMLHRSGRSHDSE